MSTRAAGCFIIILAAVLAVVWRRRQRWRRARPWLAKLRAEIEKERESCPRADTRPVTPRPTHDRPDTPRASHTPISKELSSDKGKRTKERRKRGKESKPRVTIPPSPRLVPLPASPTIAPIVLSSPIPTMTETTPAPSSAPVPKPRLPAFPPASPLPPSLARKPPPVVRKTTPSLTSINTAVKDDPPNTKDDRPKPGRKQSQQSRKPSGPTPESTQIASLKGALEAARLREEEVAEERKVWHKKERELQTQVNQLSHQLHALTIAFATGGGQGFPPYGYGYPPVDPAKPEGEPTTAYPAVYYPFPQYPPFIAGPQPHTPMTPQAHPMPMMSPPPMTPPQPYLFSAHPWATHRGASPMPGHMTGMSSPGGIPMNHGRHHFYTGSPRRGGSRPRRQGTGTPSTPSVGSIDDSIPLPERDDYPLRADSNLRDNTPASSRDDYIPPLDDYIPLREDYIPIPPRSSGTKREREDSDDDDSSSDSCDSDDDSVIFEDGSVGESVNLSLRGDSLRGGDNLSSRGKDNLSSRGGDNLEGKGGVDVVRIVEQEIV